MRLVLDAIGALLAFGRGVGGRVGGAVCESRHVVVIASICVVLGVLPAVFIHTYTCSRSRCEIQFGNDVERVGWVIASNKYEHLQLHVVFSQTKSRVVM